jgi:chromosome segregation ATPase
MERSTFALLVVALLSTACAAQDSQSLGDVARQARAQKQAKGNGSKASSDSKDQDSNSANPSRPKPSRVITNDDSPNSTDLTPVVAKQSSENAVAPVQAAGNRDAQGEHWKSQIQSQKEAIASLQSQITELSNSIHYTGANCVANCEKWNENQQRKQEQVEAMRAQLEEQKQHLEEMQEQARKQGFGSSVYDP